VTILIDTHAHLDFKQFSKDLDSVLARAAAAGVAAIVNAGADERSSRQAIKLSKKYKQISAAVGVHPHDADNLKDDWLVNMENMASEDCVLAIGETGLDYYRNLSSAEKQVEVFCQHIELANRLEKPLIVHTRNASEETYRVLKENLASSTTGVMHCFSGDLKDLDSFLTLDFYISLAGPVTYPRSEQLREVVSYIPSNRLLLETDSPYLPPQTVRGKRNEPAYIREIYEQVALILNLELDQLADQVYLNALRLFSDQLIPD